MAYRLLLMLLSMLNDRLRFRNLLFLMSFLLLMESRLFMLRLLMSIRHHGTRMMLVTGEESINIHNVLKETPLSLVLL